MVKKNDTDFIKKEEILLEKKEDEIRRKENEIEQMIRAQIIENKHIYEKLLELEEEIKGEQNLNFIHIDDWKKYIWDSCKYRRAREIKDLVVHICDKTNKYCHFVDCPKNKKHSLDASERNKQ